MAMYQSPEIIAKVGSLLQQPISQKNIVELEKLRFPLAKATTDMLRFLYEKRKQMLWPKDMEKLTEMDRSTRLNGDLAHPESDYRLLKKIEDLVSDRINLYKELRTG